MKIKIVKRLFTYLKGSAGLVVLSVVIGMIFGASTVAIPYFAGRAIDITPPTICTGNVVFNANYAANIKIPILKDGKRLFDINIAIKGDD